MTRGTCGWCGGLRKEMRLTRAGLRCEDCIRAQQKRKPNYMTWHKSGPVKAACDSDPGKG